MSQFCMPIDTMHSRVSSRVTCSTMLISPIPVSPGNRSFYEKVGVMALRHVGV